MCLMPEGEPYIPPFIRRVMKDASEEELLQGTENLRRYFKALYAVYLKIEEQKSRGDSVDRKSHDRFQMGGEKRPPSMKTYFGYIRVSTVKQGQQGSSLQEQRAAIEAFAQRHNLAISEWFEDRETAAKKGRSQFLRMMTRLETGKAAGVLLHKIDRGARNLWDWARIQNLLDAGLEVFFVHDNLDMGSRGGRLAADIQAVVAADYVRNLRDEVLKGQRGRLKQGLFPFAAPIGYCNNGKGKAKTIDPADGPFVRLAFEMYASREYSFDSLRIELQRRGLAGRGGKPLSRCTMTSMLRNPFYTGVIHVKSTGELFTGIHEPLISVHLFREVQNVLDGKIKKGPTKHQYLYRQLFSCGECGSTLVGERQKGHIYYRCHTSSCPTTGVREEIFTAEFVRLFGALRLSKQDLAELRPLLVEDDRAWELMQAERVKAASIRVAALEEREARLTDMYMDGLIGRDEYQTRKGTLILELAEARQARQTIVDDRSGIESRIEGFFAFVNEPEFDNPYAYPIEFREALRSASSNRRLIEKKPYVTLQRPLGDIASELAVLKCAPSSCASRTFTNYRKVVRILQKYLKDWEPPEEYRRTKPPKPNPIYRLRGRQDDGLKEGA
jgi:site-specific DNA recombinase